MGIERSGSSPEGKITALQTERGPREVSILTQAIGSEGMRVLLQREVPEIYAEALRCLGCNEEDVKTQIERIESELTVSQVIAAYESRRGANSYAVAISSAKR